MLLSPYSSNFYHKEENTAPRKADEEWAVPDFPLVTKGCLLTHPHVVIIKNKGPAFLAAIDRTRGLHSGFKGPALGKISTEAVNPRLGYGTLWLPSVGISDLRSELTEDTLDSGGLQAALVALSCVWASVHVHRRWPSMKTQGQGMQLGNGLLWRGPCIAGACSMLIGKLESTGEDPACSAAGV